MDSVKKATKDIKTAKADDAKANQELANAQAELTSIRQYLTDLGTERKMYSALQPLKTNITLNQKTIISDLSSFASTLQ